MWFVSLWTDAGNVSTYLKDNIDLDMSARLQLVGPVALCRHTYLTMTVLLSPVT